MASQSTATAPTPEALVGSTPETGVGNTTTTTTTTAPSNSKPEKLDVDKSKPEDFVGEVATNNDLPSAETIKKLQDYVVLDKYGKTHTFKSLYNGPNVARRILVVFVRHFFCGNCQEYLRTLSESITPDSLLNLPVSTFIVVVGCGDPELIDMYVETTKCPFPVYTDPKRHLFDQLGMVKTLGLGERPAYMKKGMWQSSFDSFIQAVKHIPRGLALKSGDQRQVGGEFLFEPSTLSSPMPSPQLERSNGALNSGADETEVAEEKSVTWCHRMRSTRDHAEIPELMEILGLDGQGKPIADAKRWNAALQQRKGVGESLAKRMAELKDMERAQ